MDTRKDPREIAEAILTRSVCAVQVGACLADGWGVFSWGWNSSGAEGMGEHAECACLRRANFRRKFGATIYVAARRKRNGRIVTAKPCEGCEPLLKRWGLKVWYRDGEGDWRKL